MEVRFTLNTFSKKAFIPPLVEVEVFCLIIDKSTDQSMLECILGHKKFGCRKALRGRKK